jgi:hypothetical protein
MVSTQPYDVILILSVVHGTRTASSFLSFHLLSFFQSSGSVYSISLITLLTSFIIGDCETSSRF